MSCFVLSTGFPIASLTPPFHIPFLTRIHHHLLEYTIHSRNIYDPHVRSCSHFISSYLVALFVLSKFGLGCQALSVVYTLCDGHCISTSTYLDSGPSYYPFSVTWPDVTGRGFWASPWRCLCEWRRIDIRTSLDSVIVDLLRRSPSLRRPRFRRTYGNIMSQADDRFATCGCRCVAFLALAVMMVSFGLQTALRSSTELSQSGPALLPGLITAASIICVTRLADFPPQLPHSSLPLLPLLYV